MGNSANRSELRKLLGRKFAKKEARKIYDQGKLNFFLKLMRAKPGDLYFDCDGVNHRVGKVTPHFNKYGYLYEVEIEDEVGNYRCMCSDYVCARDGYPPLQAPQPANGIVEYQKSWVQTDWAKDSAKGIEIQRRIDAGIPFCDEQGVLLPVIYFMQRVAKG